MPDPSLKSSITIEHLADHTDTIPQLARWLLAEWGHLLPRENRATIATIFGGRTHRDRVPQTFVAMDGSQPVGMASLEAHDMVTRPELSPWLSGVYVLPEYRGHGVGSALVEAVVAATASLDFETLYLFTPDRMSFYQRMGWQEMEKVRYRGVDVVIMRYTLSV
jgi:GNAT superfamily N-acetyltransferase